MQTTPVHTLILGAGPAGLAAGYTLAKAGKQPVILEKDKVAGGLMRSIKRNGFTLDVGRKELYNRLAKVDAFWEEILDGNYRVYAHRGGVLYRGNIIDTSPAYQGFRRGMPWSTFLGCSFDFLRARLKSHATPPRNVEEYFYRNRGRQPTQVFSQGFQEKLTGTKWVDIPLPENVSQGHAGFWKTLKGALVRTFSGSEPNTYKGIWRHPAKGTGQICEALEQKLTAAGGRIQFGAQLTGMTCSADKVQTVTVQIGTETIVYEPQNVLSSIPLEMLVQYLTARKVEQGNPAQKSDQLRKKTVVLIYLFLDEPPRFPHAWLNVTSPDTRIGRITNYAALENEMVPAGKSCFCCEFYCFGEDPLLKLDNPQFAELALAECAKFNLLDRTKCFDNLVIRLPGADASQNRHNWINKIRLGLMEDIKPFKNLYYVNRTDLDIATLAGMESAEAILSGDRATFDQHIDPTTIGIRSEKKSFEFKVPAT